MEITEAYNVKIVITDNAENIQVKPWGCRQCGRTLGTVARVKRGDYRFRVLTCVHAGMIFETMLGATVTCPQCGEAREWHPDQDAMDALVENRRRIIRKS